MIKTIKKSLVLFMALFLLAWLISPAFLAPKPAQAASLAGFYAYVANETSNTVTVIDLAANTVVSTITLPAGTIPAEVVSLPNSPYVYVTDINNNTVVVIDKRTNAVATTIAGFVGPQGIAITPDGSKIYVVDVGSNTVKIIDTSTNTISTTITDPAFVIAWDIAISPDGKRAYVTNDGGSGNVNVIDLSTNTVIQTVVTGGIDSAGITVSPDSKTVYVCDPGGLKGFAINASTYAVSPIAGLTPAVGPWGVAVNPAGTKAYFTDSFFGGGNKILIVNPKTNSQTGTIAVGNGPTEVVFNSDGSRAYVTNYNSNTVSVINTSSGTVVATVTVGTNPYGIAIADAVGPTGSVSIDGGAAHTTTLDVTLDLSAADNVGVKQTMISNSSLFAGASWEDYSSSKSWKLLNGYGTKKVYVKYRDTSLNESKAYTDSIILERPRIVTGPGFDGGPHVRLFDEDGNLRSQYFAYDEEFKGGVNVAYGDVNGDGEYEIVTGAGASGGPHVRVFNRKGDLLYQFFAYDEGFKGGVNVACGDVNNDGIEEIITGAGASGGPHVRVFNRKGDLLYQFFAYDEGFKGGVNVACGDVNNDGIEEIVTGAGASGGPHVRVFNRKGDLLYQFFAYDQGFKGGVNVACGDVNNDGMEEIITGAGPGGGPHVRVFNRKGDLLYQFFAYDEGFKGGVNVTCKDMDGDGMYEIVTGAGSGGGPHVRVLNRKGKLISEFFAYDEAFKGGVYTASLDL